MLRVVRICQINNIWSCHIYNTVRAIHHKLKVVKIRVRHGVCATGVRWWWCIQCSLQCVKICARQCLKWIHSVLDRLFDTKKKSWFFFVVCVCVWRIIWK